MVVQAFRDRRLQVVGFAGATFVSLYLASEQIDAFAFAPAQGRVGEKIAELRATLPADQSDGTVLEDVGFDGRRVTRTFLGDARLDMRMIRDSGRDERCKIWGRSLRTREIGSVEYRYRVEGSTSSVFIDRSVCG